MSLVEHWTPHTDGEPNELGRALDPSLSELDRVLDPTHRWRPE